MITFIIIALISTIAQFAVSVNYNMVDYLPDDAPSIVAMDLMEKEFDEPIANARVMVRDVSITEASAYKDKLAAIDGVTSVTWLDDVMDIKTPIEMANQDTVESYYQDESALFSINIREGEEVEATEKIYNLIGEENAISGEAVDTATSQKMAGKESLNAALLLVPIIIIILVLSTSSWMEPLFFLTAIGVSVIINLGTNIFIGEISYVTQSVAPILQLAVSLDYAIFLLHSFSDYRKQVSDPKEAMQLAIKRSFPAIAASASTTFFGFMALTFMDFGIGADLGLNLVKGIVLSFISVIVFLPALTLMFYKWIDRTQHRPLVPSIKNIGKHVMKFRIPSLLLVLLLIVPAFLAQSGTSFIYGTGEQPETTRAGADAAAIQEEFGENTPMALLVPNGDMAKEEELVQQLEKLPNVSSVISYVNVVSSAIPPDYLEESTTEQFYSENYTRITLNTETGSEGEAAFSLIEDVRDTAETYYDDNHLLGESVTLYDMKRIVEEDNTVVNLLTVIAIAIVLLITFRSISIPAVLLLTIQSAVWFNLSVPYFMDSSLVYVGYLIISTVQLAATVDYGILFTETYQNLRKEMPAMEAIKKTIDDKIFAIFISASILSSVGFILSLTSSNPIVSSIGLLLGRGALLAFIMVVFVLPAMLVIFDRVIEKTTLRANFYKGKGK
ncbi:putative RND superfamily exporter protein [Virgibacillus litoralis]|uniref:RND superfamily exporter protein n=2 Tax=Virgibacillus litoralis TaxID=578221 RepID=A0ABS4H9Y1_9BACI|nr:putative RND superfamily exporter protein [Virgibacillus litoralis]